MRKSRDRALYDGLDGWSCCFCAFRRSFSILVFSEASAVLSPLRHAFFKRRSSFARRAAGDLGSSETGAHAALTSGASTVICFFCFFFVAAAGAGSLSSFLRLPPGGAASATEVWSSLSASFFFFFLFFVFLVALSSASTSCRPDAQVQTLSWARSKEHRRRTCSSKRWWPPAPALTKCA